MKMKRRSELAILAVVGLLITNCTTIGFKFDEEKKVAADDRAIDAGVIVQQTGSGQTAIGKMDRDGWVEVRKSAKSDYVKMYAALGAQDFEVAKTEARAYLTRHPRDLHALNVLATALAMEGEYSLAAYYGNMIEKYYPGQSISENLQGLAVMRGGKASMNELRRAESHFRTAMSRSDREIAAGLNLGHLQLMMGNVKSAAATFYQVRGRCDSCTESLLGLGLAQSRLGRFPEAKSTFETVLKRDKNHPIALYRLALIERHGFRNNSRAKDYLDRLVTQSADTNSEMKRRANVLLRRIQAAENGSTEPSASFSVTKQVVGDIEGMEE